MLEFLIRAEETNLLSFEQFVKLKTPNLFRRGVRANSYYWLTSEVHQCTNSLADRTIQGSESSSKPIDIKDISHSYPTLHTAVTTEY